ncbi:coronin-2B [Parasteatoda tepidariorum]|uniref:coronin-2B n=1 Tax=Parasteatoda tepidariorum TaxID=114398 RepID=UPI0039BCFCC0
MIDINSINKCEGKLSFRGIRSSKFKHVYGSAGKKDKCFDGIKITKNAHDSSFCAVNPKFIAIATETAGGGSFLVIPLEMTGRIDATAGRVTGHHGPILDLQWNPFNDNIIASSSDDCTVKIWYIPDDGLKKSNMNKPIMDLTGHKRRVGYIVWHPTAENILFSVGFDYSILVWNIGENTLVNSICCHPDTIYSLSFNREGSLIATTCKDKKLRVIDARSGAVIKVMFFTFVKYFVYEHQISMPVEIKNMLFFFQHNLDTPLRIENIDSSSGVLFPFYDHDTKMVYVAGKGDGNIRYYEIVNEPPWCHYLSQFLTGFPQRGLGIMPKRGLDVLRCEVFRFYKLHAVKPLCETISMIVPRKSEQFQEDLFPDTAAPTPSLTAREWLNGKNRNPILISMKTGAGARTNKPVVYNPDRQYLITADRNNERKFIFISEDNKVDYRDLKKKGNEDAHPNNASSWQEVSPRQLEPKIISHTLPVASFVTIEDDSSSEQDDSSCSEFSKDSDLPETCKKLTSLVKELQNKLQIKDERIKELEEKLSLLQNNFCNDN